MNITKESHPKSFELFRAYIKNQILSSSEKFSALPKEATDALVGDNIISLAMNRGARDAYDFLDGQGIIVSVWNPGGGWKYRIGDGVPMEATGGQDRKGTEQRAFLEAFNRLEKR